MDVLADVFATTRVGHAICGAVELDGDWGMAFDRQDKAGFHLVRGGRCWLRVEDDDEALELAEGDVVVLPRGYRHVLSAGPRSASRPYQEVIGAPRPPAPRGPRTSLLCGAFAFDTPEPHPLLAALPRAIHVVTRTPGAPARLRALMELLEHELSAPSAGSGVASRRLCDVLFVYALRGWFEDAHREATGWLGALRDAATARALGALHAEPARPWTLASLAGEVGVSRATLARKFRQLVGEAPLAYLRRWRMTLAAQSLRRRDASLAELALEAGYDSEAAFHRAFTRERGTTPAEYRKAERQRALDLAASARFLEG